MGNWQQEVLFIDVESSGLHPTSYPIEIAWATLDLETDGFLIRPLDTWGEDDWSPEAEGIHRIPRSLLLAGGIPAREAAEAINSALAGKAVFAADPQWDRMWIDRLFVDTGIARRFRVLDYADAIHPLITARDRSGDGSVIEILHLVEERFPHTHRAAEDALRMAARYLAIADPDRFRKQTRLSCF